MQLIQTLYLKYIMSTITGWKGKHVSFTDSLAHAKEKLNKSPG